jgi:hypothetical protein
VYGLKLEGNLWLMASGRSIHCLLAEPAEGL